MTVLLSFFRLFGCGLPVLRVLGVVSLHMQLAYSRCLVPFFALSHAFVVIPIKLPLKRRHAVTGFPPYPPFTVSNYPINLFPFCQTILFLLSQIIHFLDKTVLIAGTAAMLHRPPSPLAIDDLPQQFPLESLSSSWQYITSCRIFECRSYWK